MNVLILPSWCPRPHSPLSGTFFLEQADAVARLHPDWNVFFLSWDPDAAKLLTRHPTWLLDNMAKLCARALSARVHCTRRPSGLHLLEVWTPVLRTNSARSMLACLQKHAEKALAFLETSGQRPDLIHAHASMPAGKAACDIFHQKGIPYIVTEHMGPFPWPSMLLPDGSLLPEIGEAFTHAQKRMAVSSALAARLNELHLGDDIAVIPNGVDADCFWPGGPKNSHAQRTTFLTIGWPSRQKGTDILLEAFARLNADAPDTSLHIVGDSEERQTFERLAASLGMQQAVTWHGNVPRSALPGLIADCDIFVLPSRGETFGVACVEALMCGKPVIATACGGPEDIVTPGNGILVPVDDVDALARAMRECMTKNFSAAEIRADAVRRFSLASTAAAVSAVYEKFAL